VALDVWQELVELFEAYEREGFDDRSPAGFASLSRAPDLMYVLGRPVVPDASLPPHAVTIEAVPTERDPH
jgi:hypothetical protein